MTLSRRILITLSPIAALISPTLVFAQSDSASSFTAKRCVNMGNALETPKGYDWGGRPYGKEDYQRIAAAGFDTVRIPVRWSDFTGPAPAFRIHPDFAELVDQQVAWATGAGLNVVLNVHHFEEIMDNPASQMARFRAIWTELSERYQSLPANVWFEVLNEPHKQLKGSEMRQAQAQALSIIRRKHPERIVILGGEEWSGIRSLGTNLSTDDPNVVYTFHYYDPFDFTHQQADWLGDDMPKGKRDWGSKQDRSELASAVETAVAFREATGRPVFLGEFGVHSPVTGSERHEWAGAVAKAMGDADIPWCLWSYGNTFALYTDENGWDRGMLEALIPPE